MSRWVIRKNVREIRIGRDTHPLKSKHFNKFLNLVPEQFQISKLFLD